MAMLNNQRVKTIYSKTIFLPGDFPCPSCSPGTVNLEDTEALRQELDFALVCARRFEEAIGVLGQVAPGGLGPWGPGAPGAGVWWGPDMRKTMVNLVVIQRFPGS